MSCSVSTHGHLVPGPTLVEVVVGVAQPRLPDPVEHLAAPGLRHSRPRRRERAILETALGVDRHVDAGHRLDAGVDYFLLQRVEPLDAAVQDLLERDGGGSGYRRANSKWGERVEAGGRGRR